MSTRQRLTPHQSEQYDTALRVLRTDEVRRPDQIPTVCGPTFPLRLRIALPQGFSPPRSIGSAGALRRLYDKGYLALVIDDRTCPVYTRHGLLREVNT